MRGGRTYRRLPSAGELGELSAAESESPVLYQLAAAVRLLPGYPVVEVNAALLLHDLLGLVGVPPSAMRLYMGAPGLAHVEQLLETTVRPYPEPSRHAAWRPCPVEASAYVDEEPGPARAAAPSGDAPPRPPLSFRGGPGSRPRRP